MADNENVNQAELGVQAADIPDLKKKEKERKKAGAGWSGAKPSGGAFSGAAGGAGGAGARAAASASSSLGGAAAGEAGASWLSTMIANLTATVLGKAILAAGAAMFLVGAGALGYSMLNGGVGGDGGLGGDLGAIPSSIKVRVDGGDRTGYIASNGEIMFEPLKAAAAKKAGEAVPPEQAAHEAVPPVQTAEAVEKGGWNPPGLEHNLSGAKLSSNLGGGFGGKNIFSGNSPAWNPPGLEHNLSGAKLSSSLGGKNIFSGNSPALKFNEGLSKTNIKGAAKGRLSASKNAPTGRRVPAGRGPRVKANRAFGQLKVAKGMSALGAGTSGTEGARSTAAAAFDGSPTGDSNVEDGRTGPAGRTGRTGRTVPTGPVDTPSFSGGAPDITAPNVDIPQGVGVDKLSFEAINAIAAMAKKAGALKKKAAQMMMMGLALIIAGAAMMGIPIIGPIIGAILIAIGVMIIGMSIMLSQMAAMMKGMADSMSQGLAARTSDVKQNEINKYCIDKAYNEGTDPKNCNPPDSVTENERINKNDSQAVQEHKKMIDKTGRVEGPNGKPAGQ